VLPKDSTLTKGTGSFSVTLQTAGNQSITATDTVKATITGATSSMAVRNAVPLVYQPLSPAAVPPGGAGFTLTVNGTGFVPGSEIHWNGLTLSTNFVSRSKLTADVPSTDIGTANTASLTVVNLAPGGGSSNTVFFETRQPVSSVTLNPGANLAVGEPEHLATGDFNGDGKLDLIAPYTGGYPAPGLGGYVLLSNGDGTFRPAIYYSAGEESPFFVAVGDFNSDGKLDAVVANADIDADDVSVLLGNGEGTFQPEVGYFTGGRPECVAVGDFNGDGKLDLVVTNTWVFLNQGPGVSVLLGNGDGTFQPAVNFSVGPLPQSVAVGDFNGDGKLDLAVVDLTTGNVSILLGNGDGMFQAAVDYNVGGGAYSVAVADFNGDGNLDLAVGHTGGQVSIVLGNGDGTFQPPASYVDGSNNYASWVEVGDFNGDGKLDLVVGNLGTNTPVTSAFFWETAMAHSSQPCITARDRVARRSQETLTETASSQRSREFHFHPVSALAGLRIKPCFVTPLFSMED
jgi:hypothetical protein